ncbi:SPFH/Band 7/PHB domain protein [Candidatus Sumerlaeota bacterium]|nr:SPFH/Band 7/PHB domain protein [Candidatus Sumerlaeota bacterium]
MGPILTLAIVLAIFVLVFTFQALIVVRQSEMVIIERLGTFNRVLESGVNIIWPLIDRPREIDWIEMTMVNGVRYQRRVRRVRLDLRETVYDFPRQGVITRDNVMTEINALLYFQITDPKKAVYEIANLPDAIEKLTQTTLRNVIGEMDLDQTLSSRETINAKLRAILDEASDKWGVKINRVELQEITPPPDIRNALEKQMRAERDRRAVVLTADGEKSAVILQAEGFRNSQITRAEGDKQAAILQAEGERQARVLCAQGEAEAIEKITNALEKCGTDPAQYLIAMRYLETFKEMVSGNQGNQTVYIPYEATAILGSIGGLRDLFKIPTQAK